MTTEYLAIHFIIKNKNALREIRPGVFFCMVQGSYIVVHLKEGGDVI